MITSKPLRAAIYHRVSTLDQDATLAREELRIAAQARGMKVVLEIEETGTGANSRLSLGLHRG
ncbi:MAG: recombinase family protein [Myxococcales bacterium]|nr:recombinase family protein [Myxococcales bacterium]